MNPARVVLAALALAAWTQAQAGLFDDDEARKSIAATQAKLDGLQRNLEARLAAIEEQTKSQGLDLLRDLEGIKSDIAKIRGQIEVMTYELTEAQKRQKDLYVDLDSRLRKIEGGSAPAAADAPPAATPPTTVANAPVTTSPPPAAAPPAPIMPVSAQEQRAYDAALDQFKRGDYNGAIASFQSFVKTYPRSLLASSAQYWVGNAQFARKDYRTAIASQRSLIQLWPDSPKIPDALLNIASAQSELGDNTAARRTLEELIGKYPQSEPAGKAKQRLGMR
jgi:tol-pal system protein YbgF